MEIYSLKIDSTGINKAIINTVIESRESVNIVTLPEHIAQVLHNRVHAAWDVS